VGSTREVTEPEEGAAGSRDFDLDAWIRPLYKTQDVPRQPKKIAAAKS